MSRTSAAETAVEMARQEVKAAQDELYKAWVEEDADLPRVTVFESRYRRESKLDVEYVIVKRTPKSIKVRPVGHRDGYRTIEFRPRKSYSSEPPDRWYLYPRSRSAYSCLFVKLGDDGNFVYVGG